MHFSKGNDSWSKMVDLADNLKDWHIFSAPTFSPKKSGFLFTDTLLRFFRERGDPKESRKDFRIRHF